MPLLELKKAKAKAVSYKKQLEKRKATTADTLKKILIENFTDESYGGLLKHKDAFKKACIAQGGGFISGANAAELINSFIGFLDSHGFTVVAFPDISLDNYDDVQNAEYALISNGFKGNAQYSWGGFNKETNDYLLYNSTHSMTRLMKTLYAYIAEDKLPDNPRASSTRCGFWIGINVVSREAYPPNTVDPSKIVFQWKHMKKYFGKKVLKRADVNVAYERLKEASLKILGKVVI